MCRLSAHLAGQICCSTAGTGRLLANRTAAGGFRCPAHRSGGSRLSSASIRSVRFTAIAVSRRACSVNGWVFNNPRSAGLRLAHQFVIQIPCRIGLGCCGSPHGCCGSTCLERPGWEHQAHVAGRTTVSRAKQISLPCTPLREKKPLRTFKSSGSCWCEPTTCLAQRTCCDWCSNPPVGCVILDTNGHLVGEGYHERKGEPHAETQALAAASDRAGGGSAIVTLEPCNHFGRAPPCRQALIEAGVARVIISVMDPTSRGEGGAAALRRAGVDVERAVGRPAPDSRPRTLGISLACFGVLLCKK